MTITQLSTLYSSTLQAFDQVLTNDATMQTATTLQAQFEKELAQFQSDNPDTKVFVDYMNRQVLIRTDK